MQLSRWLTLLLTVEAVSDCTQNVSKAWEITARADFEQIQVEPSKWLCCWDFLLSFLFLPLSFPCNLPPFLSPAIPFSLRKPFSFCPQPCLSLSHHTQNLFGLVRIYFQIYLSSHKTKSQSQCSIEISVFQKCILLSGSSKVLERSAVGWCWPTCLFLNKFPWSRKGVEWLDICNRWGKQLRPNFRAYYSFILLHNRRD